MKDLYPSHNGGIFNCRSYFKINPSAAKAKRYLNRSRQTNHKAYLFFK